MKNMLNEPNPLRSGPGKGSTPRNISKKFRKNYDGIKWKTPMERLLQTSIENVLLDEIKWEKKSIKKMLKKFKKKGKK